MWVYMDDEWDLHAVVKGCAASTGKASTVDDYDDGSYNLESLAAAKDGNRPFVYPTFGDNRRNVSGGLEDVYKAGCGRPPPTTAATTSAAAIDVDRQLPMLTDSHSFTLHTMNIQSTRTKKRRNQEKMVFQLTQEELSNDLWAWRKYGQKPIKGSPYPRNYYRCSTTKACGAKKQVERSPMDPNVFIVSYSGEHIHPRPTHRSSLAGSTRSSKFNTDNNKPPASVAVPLLEHPPCSSSSSSFSSTTSFKEDECDIDDEDNLMIPSVAIKEEVLKRFRNLRGGGSSSC